MATPLLYALVQREGTAFERITNRWRPKDLLFELQAKEMMKDMARRYASLLQAEGELQMLDRADFYLKLVRKMKLVLRRAYFVRRLNQLAFLEAVAEFYAAFGLVLRFLKIDLGRGLLAPEPV